MPPIQPHKTIALLFHEQDSPATIHNYLITYYARIWQQLGFKVFALFGTHQFIPADLILVHVDLSVVPEAYCTFAARYPVVLNGRVRDIRKSAISQQLLKPGDNYSGKVIVKSDCNYAALPEQRLHCQSATTFFSSPLDYHVFPNIHAVPDQLWQEPSLVVEQFLPELIGGLYHVRFYNFLGSKGNCMRIASTHPIVHISHAVTIEQIPLDPRLDELRQAHHFDYGKFDYVERDGEIILFDTNKTTGFVGGSTDPKWQQARYERALGILDYL
ncbi:MAG TPA: hypothetical protein PKE57_00025 [Cellvibrionaceae bacterium]|nr:hypothetical protein [Cellvibrionaceae bacterium]HMW50063.1 hypothetical protein [Cellvibrionaceae bacterium]HMW73654.1 hypothetical protein [Cellvibrionaceae bacterium]HMY40893.1 hypothetical protein [Marinagarivorans sp.]HNG61934.1 hypothetical protein [Cellvibrionaceae bacterium]